MNAFTRNVFTGLAAATVIAATALPAHAAASFAPSGNLRAANTVTQSASVKAPRAITRDFLFQNSTGGPAGPDL